MDVDARGKRKEVAGGGPQDAVFEHELQTEALTPRKEHRYGAAPSDRVGARATIRRWMRATRSERGAVSSVMCAKAAIKVRSSIASSSVPGPNMRPG